MENQVGEIQFRNFVTPEPSPNEAFLIKTQFGLYASGYIDKTGWKTTGYMM